jgi:hypothetical protein
MESAFDTPVSAAGGTYSIVDASDSTMISVMPALRTAMMMRIPANMAALAANEPTMSVSDITRNVVEDLGPGPQLLGRETHRYRVTRAATLTTTVGGRSCSAPMDHTTDLWIATDPAASAAIRAAQRRVAAVFGATSASGQSSSDVFDRVAPNRPPRGLILRSIRRNNLAGAAADSSTYETEYTAISYAAIDSAAFATPPGFTVQDMRGMPAIDASAMPMPGGAGTDSTSLCRGAVK